MKTQDMKLAEFVNSYPQLLNFLERLEISLGFADKTIGQVCSEYNIPVLFFVELMQLIIKKYGFNPKYINEFQPDLTIKYLRNSHKSYTQDYLAEIELLIERLNLNEQSRKSDCGILMKYFSDYKTEFLKHINFEDNTVFPYIISIERIIGGIRENEAAISEHPRFRISKFISIHDSLDEKLNDLKNLIIKYFKPFNETEIVRALLKMLFELEQDLILHELIENEILFPQAITMEEKIFGRNRK